MKALFPIFATPVFIVLFSFLVFTWVSAACPTGQICIENPLKATSFQELLDSLINFIFFLGIVLTPLMVVIAGFYLMTAAGDPHRVQTAKQIFLYTCVGLAIILFAKGLVSVLKAILGTT